MEKPSYYSRNRARVLAKQKERYESKKDELRAYQREYIRSKRAAMREGALDSENGKISKERQKKKTGRVCLSDNVE